MSRIVWVTGPAGAGKSTVCDLLASRRNRSVVIPVDTLREWVVSGFAGPDHPDAHARLGQFGIAHRNAVRMAIAYRDAGFDVFIDGSIPPPAVVRDVEPSLDGAEVTFVAITPTAEAALERNRARTTKSPETQAMIDGWLERVCATWREHPLPEAWVVVDSTGEGPEATADRIEAALAVRGAG